MTTTLIRDFRIYWQQLADGQVPDRASFQPSAVRHLLPNLFIAEIEPVSQRIRFKLVGTLADAHAGISMTGRYLDEFSAGETRDLTNYFDEIYRRVARTGMPEAGSYTWPSRSGTKHYIKFGMFPFRVDGRIREIFCIEDYSEIYAHDPLTPWHTGPAELTD